MEENNDIQLSIREINETSFTLRQLPLPIEQIRFGENLSFGFGFEVKINLTIEEFGLNTSIQYLIEGIEKPVIELVVDIIYDVRNLAKVVQSDNEGQYHINDGFMATLAGVTIGTIRGILSANTKGNPMAKFPLPIINPKELIGQMNKQAEEKNR